tara:strand:+ start:3212 stop:3745 length:534 start_codon:yes stop_codon:yes gene_type:complete
MNDHLGIFHSTVGRAVSAVANPFVAAGNEVVSAVAGKKKKTSQAQAAIEIAPPPIPTINVGLPPTVAKYNITPQQAALMQKVSQIGVQQAKPSSVAPPMNLPMIPALPTIPLGPVTPGVSDKAEEVPGIIDADAVVEEQVQRELAAAAAAEPKGIPMHLKILGIAAAVGIGFYLMRK